MGGGPEVDTVYSPQQEAIMNAGIPLWNQGIQKMLRGDSPYEIPDAPAAPTAPSMTGVLTGVPQYQIPDVSMMMPTQQWYGSLAPEVVQGAWAPYQDASQQLVEQMVSRGQGGAASAGYSGTTGDALGRFWSEAGRDVGMNLWGMSAPAMQAGWQAQLGQNILGHQLGITEAQQNYSNLLTQQARDYQAGMGQWQSGIGAMQSAWGAMPSMMNVSNQYVAPVYPNAAQQAIQGIGGLAAGALLGGTIGGQKGGVGQFPGMLMGGIGGLLSGYSGGND